MRLQKRLKPHTVMLLVTVILLIGACDSTNDVESDEIVWEQAASIELNSLRVTSSGNLFGGRSAFIYRSTGNGSSWVQVFDQGGSVLGVGKGGALCTADSEPGLLFLDAIIYCSTDAGATWTRAADNSNFLGVDITAILLLDDGQLLVGTRGRVHQGDQARPKRGLFTSSDLGQTWQETQLTTDDPLAGIQDSFILDGGNLIIVRYREVAITDNVVGYFRSTDGARTWERLPKPPFDQFLVQAMSWSVDGSIYVAGAESFAGVGRVDGIYSSVDLGESWSRTSLETEREMTGVTALGDGRVFAAAGYAGVFVSEDEGVTWTESNEGIPVSSIGTLRISVDKLVAGPDFLFALTEQGLYRARRSAE